MQVTYTISCVIFRAGCSSWRFAGHPLHDLSGSPVSSTMFFMSNSKTANLPLISVIIPVYNAHGTLRRAADSVLAQTYGNIELILVDDGSTDESPAMVDDYASTHPEKIRVLHKENGGLMRAWQDGLSVSTGRFLCFVDSDDWIDPEMISVMAQHLKRSGDGSCPPGQIVCCGYVIEYPGGKQKAVGHALPEGVYEGDRLRKELKNELLGHEQRRVILSRCMKLISRELILDNTRYLDFSIRLGEDVNITVPALLDAERVVLLNTPYYHYTFDAGSMAHRYDPRLYEDCVRLRKALRTILRSKASPAEENGNTDAADREFFFLLLQILKTQLRRTDGPGAAKKAVRGVQTLCRAENSHRLLSMISESVTDPANRLLVFICRKPSALRIRMIRSVFLLYEKLR